MERKTFDQNLQEVFKENSRGV